MNVTKVFGPPGSGKTTFLLGIVETELDRGVHPTKVGYFAFTKKAATEARDRAIQKFPNLNPDTDFPFFRTLHSLAYRCLGISTKDMMSPEHYREFALEAGIELAIENGEEDFVVKVDNPILNEINIARIRGMDLRTHYNKSEMQIEWYHFEYVERAYRHYKTSRNLLDFTDLLEQVLLEPSRLPELDALIIDEAQDLSRLQWRLVEQLSLRAQRAFLAGDDDQAVYTWAGADVASFLGFTGDVKVLDQSYRVPSKIHALANRVVTRIKQRQPKVWKAREEEGSISYYNDFSQVDISHGNWLILASANYMLTDMHDWIKSQGLLFERRSMPRMRAMLISFRIGLSALTANSSSPFSIASSMPASRANSL